MVFPPFDPDGSARRRRPRFRQVPLRVILPNMVTLLALCAGLTGIRMAIEDRLEFAVGAIVLAALLDGIDGRVARLLKSASRFGAELDSLADFVNFGVAPTVILYTWILNETRSLGWIAGLVFAICVALRLARFNVALDTDSKPDWRANFFVGMPAPAGALAVLLPLYLELLDLPRLPGLAYLVPVYCLAIAFLMVSRVPTFSGKKLGQRIPREMVLPVFVVFVLFAAMLVSYPWTVLTMATLAYLATIPLGIVAYRRRAATAEEGLDTMAEEAGGAEDDEDGDTGI